ncbi:carbohydrate ABC transporter permease [Pseudovibrio brasiliensis]|uniref:Sugar ABC transporter permease n=1 Tax=Pseudovibrio brasiliensis TaxID=1898042 RepID=A0ABX8AYC5_9HYPH|nr:sugar ABC transporter permease [Pseudovibrio brasiliensis]QUS58870.1 sugar ABC transporter permease [Pseudovibrio brasiliensis]
MSVQHGSILTSQTQAGPFAGLATRLFGGNLRRADWIAFALLAPTLIFFSIGVLYPLFETIRVSFLDWTGLSQPKPAGFSNYIKLFNDANFWNALRVTLTWTLACTGISVFIGWSVALISGLAPKQTAPFRVAIFAAYGISETASGLMWLGILQPDFGLLNGVLRVVGLEGWASPWLGEPSTAIWGVVAAYVWTQAGLPLLTCYAAIQAIPKSQIEAAHMDGATHFQILRYIMAPLSLPGVRIAIFINLLNSLKAFDMIHILTAGGPIRATETVGYFMYQESVVYFKQGYGAASTVVLLLAVIACSIPLILDKASESK